MNGRQSKDFRLKADATASIAALIRRSDAMEAWITVFSSMSFWRRMKWLLTGR